MVCCTHGALCSGSRRSRWDLPEPELPCTSRRVASSSSRSRAAGAPPVVCPISIATVMSRLKVSLRKGAYHPDRSPSSAPWPTAPCSARLDEVRAAQFAGEVEAKIRQDEATLETHLERLAFR